MFITQYEVENNFNFFCPMCKTNCIQTTVNKIYTSPNIFIFILNRGKNNADFNEGFDFPFARKILKQKETLNYVKTAKEKAFETCRKYNY